MIIALLVCFSTNVWLYVVCLFMSSLYLAVLTLQYITTEDEADQGCNMQHGCHVTSFNSRLSILSNITTSLFGIAFALITSFYLIKSPVEVTSTISFNVYPSSFIIGCFKLMFIYIISDKIHSLQLLLSILLRYSQTIKFLNIDIPRDSENFFPIIYLDKSKISEQRYTVTRFNKRSVNVYFDPPLSISDNSTIEYEFIPDDREHIIRESVPHDIYKDPQCFFRCHVVIKKVDQPTVEGNS